MPRRVQIPEIREAPEPPLIWWEELKQDRARRRYLRRKGASKSRAAITIVHNEPVFLPIWLRYYSRFFGPEDLYVLDNDTTDGSTDGEGFVRIPVSHDRVDHVWMVQTVERLQRELFESYDVVLVTDVDEIVTPVPEWGTLGDYIDEFAEWFMNCVGYEILHLLDREPPYDPSRPILDQRHYWYAHASYNKSALLGAPTSWQPGFHHRADGLTNYDPNLRMVHLHRMDFEICRQRHRVRRNRAWNEHDLSEGWAAHNRTVEDEEFERWFYSDTGAEEAGVRMVVEEIPESWRGLF